ncbi:hypothetical protein K440DRAFT_661567 [Wilcoxina mikolae CBS 423.85]|nr:hypothetical protein K440DRAFT_661567 [Wilcoxina mikolae CBS 423.85]
MVTGIEVAGLVLGGFPVLVQCVQSCLDAWDMSSSNSVLRRLDRDLRLEKCAVINTCKNLLISCIHPTADELKKLLDGVGWDDPELQEKLEKHLGQEYTDIFTASVTDLYVSLEKLMEAVGLDKQQKQPVLTRVKMALGKAQYLQELKNIRDINANLERLMTMSLIFDPQTPPTITPTPSRDQIAPEIYDDTRKHARSLYSVLQEGFYDCSCQESHNANLRLHLRHENNKSILNVMFELEAVPPNEVYWGSIEFEVEAHNHIHSTEDIQEIPPRGPHDPESNHNATNGSPNDTDSNQNDPNRGLNDVNNNLNHPDITLNDPGRAKCTTRTLKGIREALVTITSIGSQIIRCRSPLRENRDTGNTGSRVSLSDTAEAHTGQPSPTSANFRQSSPASSEDARQSSPASPADETQPSPTPPAEATNQIGNLCATIKQATTHAAASSPSGSSTPYPTVLDDVSSGFSHRIKRPPEDEVITSSTLVSLRELLVPELLEEKVRLKLGVQLASAMMQLHTSEWLAESWGKNDIFFLQKPIKRHTMAGELISVREPIVDKPFVRRIFERPLRPLVITETPTEKPIVEYNKSLFSLGVVLIELLFQQPIETLIAAGSPPNDDSIYAAATQKLGDIYHLAGEKYGHAVWRCLKGLSRQTNSISLDCPDFRNAVHEDIICLLENNLRGIPA